MNCTSTQVYIGMLGGGTVGGGVYQALCQNGKLIASRTGIELIIKKIAVKAYDEPRAVDIPHSLMTLDWRDVVNDPQIQLVVELVGGTGVAKEMILAALHLGKPVITANKALLAQCGEELFTVAKQHNTSIYFEASVAGGIPILRSIKEGFVCNKFSSISGIVNGTCNYILTEMEVQGRGFEEILHDAQKKGYAEANPSLDVDGHDSHHKITILASLAHNTWIHSDLVYRYGISTVTNQDIEICSQLGYRIKLLGTVKTVLKNQLSASEDSITYIQAGVAPTLIPHDHILAGVNDVFNALAVTGDVVGETFFYGKGAGQDATASAVVGDIVDAALNTVNNTPRRLPPMWLGNNIKIVAPDDVQGSFYIRVELKNSKDKNAEIDQEVIDAIKEENIQVIKTANSISASENSRYFVVLVSHTSFRIIHIILKKLRKRDDCISAPVAFMILD